MNTNEKYTRLMEIIKKADAFMEALGLFEWDNMTLAPEKAIDRTASTIGILSGAYYETIINPEVKELVEELYEVKEQLNSTQQAMIKKIRKDFLKMEKIPADEYAAYTELVTKAGAVWEDAFNAKDFQIFLPILDELIQYQKKFADYQKKPGQERYDVLLDEYEEGFTIEKLDQFFELIEREITPLVKKVTKSKLPVDTSFMKLKYPIEKQKEFNFWLAKYLGFDFTKGVLSESEHPFTLNLHNQDVRITTHYYLDNFISSIFSVIHECGHGIYEMNVADELTQTPLGGGTSMGMHESQSRFFENLLGRNKSFWIPIYKKLQEDFPEQLGSVSIDDFYVGINQSFPGLIRTEADELTYSLHVLIRYEIEKKIFADELSTKELPEVWNELYEKYLGIRPTDDQNGVLQDSHWSGGNFGYFPSYALGSAISSQIYDFMSREIDLDRCMIESDLKPIRDYLANHIHQYGASRNTSELLEGMMSTAFDPLYYINYLKEKFSRIYSIE